MNNYDILERVRLLVAQTANREIDLGDPLISAVDDVQFVWFCYTLGGYKALLITTAADQKYYEVTYDKAKEQTYVDVYEKQKNIVVPDGEWINEY